MKKILPLILVALLFGVGGYVIEGINVGIETARDCDIATLMWITGIDRLLQAGKFDTTKIICFDAPKIHFHVLKQF